MDYQGEYFPRRLLKMASSACLRLPAVISTALLLTLIICLMPVPQAAAKNFSSLPDMSTTRYGHSMTLLQNGTVLIAGGFNNNDSLKTAEIYDPETGQIAPARDMKAARMDHTATLLANGKVLVTGGRNGAAAVNTAEIFDPSTNAFKTTAENISGRVGHSATLLPNGKVLIAGGTTNNKYVAAAEIYDPETGKIVAASSLVAPRSGHTATLLPNGRVLIVGGMKETTFINLVEIFDPATGRFSAAANMLTSRYSHTATLLEDGRLLISGGRNNNGIVNSAEIFDPATGSFAQTEAMTTERDDHTSTLMPDGTVLIAGGRNARGYLNTAEVFYPETGTFIPTVNMTSIRDISSAILLSNNKVLVAGGWDGTSAACSAEIFDPELFQPKYRLHLNTAGKGDGSVIFTPGRSCSGSCSQFFPRGTSVRLTPVLDDDTVFVGWSGCDSVDDMVCVVNMSKNRLVKLKTTEIEDDDGKPDYAITATAGANGSIAPPGVTMVDRGRNITYTITPNPGYHVADVLIDGRRDLGPITSFTFTKVKKKHTISATFAPNNAVHITAIAGPDGTISPDDTVLVPSGGSQEFTITPAAGFKVADVLIDGVSVGAVATYRFSGVTADHTITASFTPIVYQITATSGSNGTIAPAGVSHVNSGSGQDFIITPATGFGITDVLVDGVSVGAVTTYKFSGVTSDHTITASFSPVIYQIAATAGSNGTIAPAGVSNVNSGSGKNYTITPAAGFKVADVLVDGVSIGAVYSYNFADVTANHTIMASFTPIVFTITATSGNSGAVSPAGVSNVNSGSGKDYTVIPASGFKVADVLVDSVSVGAVTSYSFVNVTANHTITASFAPIAYEISATSGANGSISPAGTGSVNHGAAITYAVVPATGFKVADVLVDGVSVGAVTSYSFVNVTANHTISASFSPILHIITVATCINGSIEGGGTGSVNYGSDLTCAITPAAGFKVADVLVDGVSVGAVTSYSFSNVTADHSISATFTPIVYTLAATAGVNGSIDPAGVSSVNHGIAQTFTITPTVGFKVADVLVDGVSVGAVTSYSFSNVTADHSISVTFTPIVYTLAAAAGVNGSIDPAGVSSVNHGFAQTFTFTPTVGFKVADVLVDGVSVGAVTSYSFSNVTADHTISATFTPIVYTITATAGANGGITPQGAGSVNHGAGLSYVITPAVGFKIADVLVDGVSVGAVSSRDFTDVTADHTISATFTPIVYTITATAGANGGITPPEASNVNHGSGLNYAITPATGFKIADVLVDGVSVGAVSSYAFTNITADHTISASFTLLVYTFTASAGSNGSIVPAGESSINFGAGLTCTITPAPGFKIADVLVDGVSVGAPSSYAFANAAANHSISATFTPIVYSITATAGANGGITPPGASNVNHGSGLTYTVVPAADYQVADVLVDGVSVGAVTSYTFDNVTVDHTISVTFSPIIYAFTISASAGPNGSIAPLGNTSVNRGDSLTYTIVPATGYKAADVLVDGVTVGAPTSYTFNNVQADHAISVSFIKAYTITATAGTNGSISPAGVTTVASGGSMTYIITPAPGYKVQNIAVNGVYKGASTSYSFSNVTMNYTINATFTPITYSITATAGPNGSITPTGTANVNHGSSKSYTITPVSGNHIEDVLVDGVSVGAVGSYTFNNVTAAHTIAASFATNLPVTVTASAGPNGSISPAGDVVLLSGSNQTFTFTPAAGYRVAGVMVDGIARGTLNSYTFTNIAGNHNISVSFTLDVFTITTSAGANGSIDPSGVTTLNRGEGLTYTITPAPGYQVLNVAVDGAYKGAQSSYTFSNVTANHTISATFTPIVYSIGASAGADGSISPYGTATVNQGTDKAFTITPIPGYHIADVLVDGVSVGAVGNYTFSNVMANHTISASFASNQPVTVTASAGPNGSISPAGDVVLFSGSNKMFTFTPAAGYRVADVVVDGASVGAVNSYTFNAISATNHTISVSFTADVFSISASAGTNGSIDPAGVTTLNRGDGLTYTITPNPGYQVMNVAVDGAFKGTQTSYSFSNVTANHTISATFTPLIYSITASAGTNGSITPAGTASANHGSSKSYTIAPVPGYHIEDVLVDGVSVGTVGNYTFSNVTANHTISATFAANPAVTVTASTGPNGSISPAGEVVLLSGSNQTFTFTPAAGYRVAGVVVDGASVGAVNSYTFSAISATNHTISVSFTADVFTISASAGTNGSIDPAGVTTLNRGDGITYIITPAVGYQVLNIAVDGVYKGASTSYNFANVTANHTINATFTPITYSISSSAGANGSITPAGTANVNHGSSNSYTITPTPGYHIADLLVDGVSVGGIASYTFSNVTANHTISATFAANQAVTVTASTGPNGSISPAGDVVLLSGSNQTFTFTPAAGFRVADVVVDGASVGAANSYTFSAISATNHTISVSFTVDVYTINASAGANGSIDPAGVIILSRGNGLTYNITPAAGYQVLNVAVDGVYKGALTSYTFANVTANHTINATFTPITYSITASAGADGSISPAGTVSVAAGGSKNFTITPAPGYHVNEVLVDGNSVGTVTAFAFDNVTAAHTISATFAANPAVAVTASAGPNGSISPTGEVALLSGVNQTFTFTPATGYRVADVAVDGVSVGTVNSYTFTNVTENHTVSVSFTLDVFTISATAGSNGSIDPAGVTTLNSGDSITYTITPAPGYKVLNVAVDGVYKGAVTSFSFDSVTANHTITPTFALIQ